MNCNKGVQEEQAKLRAKDASMLPAKPTKLPAKPTPESVVEEIALALVKQLAKDVPPKSGWSDYRTVGLNLLCYEDKSKQMGSCAAKLKVTNYFDKGETSGQGMEWQGDMRLPGNQVRKLTDFSTFVKCLGKDLGQEGLSILQMLADPLVQLGMFRPCHENRDEGSSPLLNLLDNDSKVSLATFAALLKKAVEVFRKKLVKTTIGPRDPNYKYLCQEDPSMPSENLVKMMDAFWIAPLVVHFQDFAPQG
jgi:hypothetical protein